MSHSNPPEINPYAAPESSLLLIDEAAPRSRYAGYGGFWRRFAALFIDQLVMFLTWFFSLILLGVMLGFLGNVSGNRKLVDDPEVSGMIGLALLFLIPLVYYPVMECSAAQATLGKMALGVQVTDLRGRRISFPRALVRFLGKSLLSPIFLVGYLMAAFTRKKQALHDMLAGTLVVRTV
jgi:uncharacterized RDD family membrane protein YckC